MKIGHVAFGEIEINGKKYNNDVTVWWYGEIEEREKSHVFSRKELLRLLESDPEIIVVGTGQSGLCKVEPSARTEAKLNGVELIAEVTPKAVEEFNKLVKKKRVIGVFHLTC